MVKRAIVMAPAIAALLALPALAAMPGFSTGPVFADFGPIASHVLIGKARGPMAADPADLPWKRLPSGRSVRP